MDKTTAHPPRSKPTISDVAAEAKVSRATVSRAITHPQLLSSATVARVNAVAKQLGYVPNHTARALSTGRTGNLALVVPDITNPFFAALMRGAQARALNKGYATFLGDSDEALEMEDVLLAKLAAQVEGFVLAAPRLPKERIIAHAERKPLVLINSDVPNIPRLLIDAATSYERGVDHLAMLGHKSIAYVSGPRLSWSNSQRLRAVSSAARRLGLKMIEIPTFRPSFEAGQACTHDLLKAGASAALAFDDTMAQGIMSGLAGLGLSVPADFSVIGCDGVLATRSYPPLDSVDIDCGLAGEEAVELLEKIIRGGVAKTRRISLPTRFVVRATTAVPGSQRRLLEAAAGIANTEPVVDSDTGLPQFNTELS